MKKLACMVCMIVLLAAASSAQQEKPSPATPSKPQPSNAVELKQPVKPEAPRNLAATVTTLPVGTPVP